MSSISHKVKKTCVAYATIVVAENYLNLPTVNGFFMLNWIESRALENQLASILGYFFIKSTTTTVAYERDSNLWNSMMCMVLWLTPTRKQPQKSCTIVVPVWGLECFSLYVDTFVKWLIFVVYRKDILPLESRTVSGTRNWYNNKITSTSTQIVFIFYVSGWFLRWTTLPVVL
jgi:hypothetical protein